jgi:hypothetical protein
MVDYPVELAESLGGPPGEGDDLALPAISLTMGNALMRHPLWQRKLRFARMDPRGSEQADG